MANGDQNMPRPLSTIASAVVTALLSLILMLLLDLRSEMRAYREELKALQLEVATKYVPRTDFVDYVNRDRSKL